MPSVVERAEKLQHSAVEPLQQAMGKKVEDPGVVVPDLSVAQIRTSGMSPNPANAESFQVSTSELHAVRQEATEKIAEDVHSPTLLGGSSSSATRGEIVNTTTEVAAVSKGQTVEKLIDDADASDDQFLTPPEQSEESEKHGSSSVAKRVVGAIGVASAGTAAAFGIGKSDQAAADSRLRSSSDGARTTVAGLIPNVRGTADETGDSSPVQEAQQTGLNDMASSTDAGNYSGYLSPPSVETRTRMFEETAAAAAAETGALARGKSYSLNGADGAPANQQTLSHLDEFEQADMRKMTSDGISSNPTYASSATVGCKITRASTFAREASNSQENVATPYVTQRAVGAGLRQVPESRFSSEIQGLPQESRSALMKKGSGFIDEPITQQPIEEVLDLYPKNPLRSDSQVPLFRILEAIQNIPADDSEAYGILDQYHGFSKVIVAMLSQFEDGALQEQGLHCIVRILRNTQSSRKEVLVLNSYGDCYRTVQGTADAVVPKGNPDIDVRSSGAVQAVVQALHNFESMRRVQLAGCAALAEIGSISTPCKLLACEYGAISLINNALRHRSTQAASSIHDIASRAVSAFCSGKENLSYKQSFTKTGTEKELLNVLQLWGLAEGNTSELLTTATKSCCSALRHLTDGCPTAGVQCVQAYGYHHLIRAMAVRRDDVAVCTLVVSAMTSITRSSGSAAEKGLQDSKPLREVLITMQAHSDQPLFIRKCLDFMDALGCYSSMREEIVAAGGIPFAADIIEQGGNDSLLLERSCGVLEKLCRSHARNQEILASHNGISSLTALLTTHQGLPGVIEKDLLALSSVCASNGKTQKEALKSGTPEQVVRSLGLYSAQNSKVAAAAAATMAAMVVPRNTAMSQSFAKLKAPELVVRAMKRHPDSVMVQENGSAAISSFCEADPRIISMILKSGISSLLVVALQRYLHKQTAVVQIVRAMRAISNEASEDSYRFKSKLLTDRSNESSLSEVFHTALSYHKKSLPDTANVIISICATINRLCMRSVAFKNEIGKDGIVEELKRLVERTAEYRELGALQPVLATICTLVLDSEDNKNRFHAVGGVEVILDVMQKWKSDTYVLEHCCAALRYSCNEHFGNCDEVKRHNGVRSILGVMELHPENVNVTLWCCLTLADLCKGDEELQSSPNVVQGIRKVVSAMTTFSGNSRFLASACEFLRAASIENDENQERIVRLGGRTAIVRALESHPSDSSLTETAAYALLLLQDVQDARISADGDSQIGFVKRLSRDLRRSSSSNRSTRSGRGLFGLKSRSFISKRKSTEQIEDDVRLSEAAGAEAAPDRLPASRPSLISFSRRSKGSRRSRRNYIEEVEDDVDDVDDVEQFADGADNGYGEYGPAPVPLTASGPHVE
ncbi:unnamed protein product [Chondrus crispus]|uniref:Uncharacterized protein n=1 Tax=Chondrus crispus TaxID=2769 RepID=R7QMM1_CHOCR|nr:unnamed protein product [Chondrus crispus]CDF38635.1 unnamed protein product [Chondrus crispus]|eukprot:XP_005718540.1 unnamed protein product [Chondrus crispus]